MIGHIEWVEMEVNQAAYPSFERAGKEAKVAVEILNWPGQIVRCNGGSMMTVPEGTYWVGVDQDGISEFWRAFGELL